MAHANVVETAGNTINVVRWLQKAKLSELTPKFAADSIAIEVCSLLLFYNVIDLTIDTDSIYQIIGTHGIIA